MVVASAASRLPAGPARCPSESWRVGYQLLAIPGLITGIVALVGLYRFWPSARWLSIAAWVYMLVWMSVSPGPVLSNAVVGAFSQCSTLLVGMVLALIYFSPAAEWFQKK